MPNPRARPGRLTLQNLRKSRKYRVRIRLRCRKLKPRRRPGREKFFQRLPARRKPKLASPVPLRPHRKTLRAKDRRQRDTVGQKAASHHKRQCVRPLRKRLERRPHHPRERKQRVVNHPHTPAGLEHASNLPHHRDRPGIPKPPPARHHIHRLSRQGPHIIENVRVHKRTVRMKRPRPIQHARRKVHAHRCPASTPTQLARQKTGPTRQIQTASPHRSKAVEHPRRKVPHVRRPRLLIAGGMEIVAFRDQSGQIAPAPAPLREHPKNQLTPMSSTQLCHAPIFARRSDNASPDLNYTLLMVGGGWFFRGSLRQLHAVAPLGRGKRKHHPATYNSAIPEGCVPLACFSAWSTRRHATLGFVSRAAFL